MQLTIRIGGHHRKFLGDASPHSPMVDAYGCNSRNRENRMVKESKLAALLCECVIKQLQCSGPAHEL